MLRLASLERSGRAGTPRAQRNAGRFVMGRGSRRANYDVRLIPGMGGQCSHGPPGIQGKRKMSVEAIPGGKRRIDRVLDPRFVADVDRLELDDLRRRRSEAEAEEEGISYLRRVLQGRIDILRAELLRRKNGAEGEHDVAGLVAGLPGILSDAGSSNFTAIPKIRMPLPNGKHRRRLERLVSDETIARLPELDVAELARAGELAHRYRDGTASVAQLLE